VSDQIKQLASALADRYAVEREIGSGGMATVYLAEDLRHHRQVAIKVLRADLAATLGPDRFLREIEIAAKLQHPNILPLLDSGEADDFLFYVMPYVEGHSLRDKLSKEGELPIGEAVRILRDVVDALTEAHANGVVHRDIKPENILLHGRHALVTDFGVAKAVSEATGREQLTTAGVALGTPAYMAPEQASADPHLDQRVDIYAVGAVAYELLTGRPVFMGTTPQMILSAHMTEPPQPVTKHRDTVPDALEAVVMRCLEKKPADRFQSAEELLPQFEALSTPSGGMTPTDTRPVAATAARRRWLLPTVLGSVAVVIVLAFVGAQVLKHNPLTVTVSNLRPVTSAAGKEWQPALSPDGNEVAFVANRNGEQSVVIRSARSAAESGEAIAAGLHDARVWLPTWSPDGETIRFLACASVSLSDCTWMETGKLGGSSRSAGLPRTGVFASWSPDGSRVAFLSGDDSLFVYSLADGTTRPLAVADGPFNHSIVWSPDGRRIAYVDGAWLYAAALQVIPSSIWIVDIEDGDPVRVTSGEFVDISPVWLDADHLLFTSNRDGPQEVYVVEVAANGPRGAPHKLAGLTDAHTISYSSAGRILAFAKTDVRQNVWSYPIGPGTVSIADGHPVTSENAVTEAHDLSPDGRQIVYSSDLGHTGNLDLYTNALEGGSPTLIAESPLNERDPRWSPDGTEIAYAVGQSPMRLLVVSAAGGTPIQADSADVVFRPSWSPSGLELAFICGQGSQELRFETCMVSREAVGEAWGEATRLTDFGCWPYDWAPDGSGVLCAVTEITGTSQGISDAVIVSRNGEELWRYDPATDGLAPSGGYPVFSQDGSIIYTAARRNDGTAGIWAIPVRGGEPRLVIAYDDDDLDGQIWLTVQRDRVYLTVRQDESDIWVADVEVER
jgi:serine/threonine protein kinase/Tol biopolymer transport system component